MKYRLCEAVLAELQRTQLPFDIEKGGRHWKIRLSGRLVGILPFGAHGEKHANTKTTKNCIAQIRRAAAGLKSGTLSATKEHLHNG